MRNKLIPLLSCLMIVMLSYSNLEAQVQTINPSEIFIGLSIIYVDRIDVKQQTFYTEFYLNMKWKGDADPRHYELMNATEFNINHVSDWSENDFNYYSAKIRGHFRCEMDVTDFPFDSQELYIRIGDNYWPATKQRYVPFDYYNISSSHLSSLEWDITQPKVHEYVDSDYGNDYSIFESTITVDRRSTAYLIKVMIPIFIVMSVALLNLFLSKYELETCMGLGITSLLSLIALHFAISDQLPQVNYPTKIDLLMIVSYLTVFLLVVEVVVANWLLRKGRKFIVRRTEFHLRIIFPFSYLTFVLWLPYM